MAWVNPEAELPFRETAHLFNSLCIIPTVLKLCEMKDGKYPLEEPYPPRGGDPITTVFSHAQMTLLHAIFSQD